MHQCFSSSPNLVEYISENQKNLFKQDMLMDAALFSMNNVALCFYDASALDDDGVP